jgi:threonyl-tRNA synthetase
MSQTQDKKLESLSKKEQQLWAMRHSAEHVLTQAMLKLYPGLKMAMGPATNEGFYFDFDYESKISEENFAKIEAEMKKIIKKDLPFKKKIISVSEAKKLFKGNQYKQEWLDEIEERNEKATVYWTADEFVDLCAGPHVSSTGDIGPFKLLSVAGAYWRGDEKNKMLTRIYGTVFSTQKELDNYLSRVEEAKKRDHRKLGKELDLFVFSELVGKGLPMFTKKGSVIRRELERFIVDEEIKRGYDHVHTPDIANVELYEKSGHYPYYKDSMYPVMQVGDERLILRPMTCPHHFQLYASRPRSYKELPMRIAELASQYRYEKSGELTGLIRVRLFCLADAHIICQKDKAEEEIDGVLDLIDYVAKVLGLKKGKDYRYRLSMGDRKDDKKYYKDDKAWDFAEEVLRKALKKRKAPFYEEEGEAAFYGPKIDVQMKNVLEKEETAFTVQYDFVMPKRFNLKYIDKDGKDKEPVIIHRSSIGALERVLALLIEHHAGNFPVWLSPVQVKVLPITERNIKYAKSIGEKIKAENIRVEIDERNETLPAKIRNAQLEKVPYMLIVGDKEEKNKKVSLRLRTEKDLGETSLKIFIEKVKKNITEKSLKL